MKLDDPTLSPDLEATGVQFQGHVESRRLGGAPGTGKTLLAKAVAREAGVPFFSLSGANFVGKFLGMGAARVRDLFTQAQATALNIILIDELDVLGKTRGISPMMDGYDERGQTLETLRHPQ